MLLCLAPSGFFAVLLKGNATTQTSQRDRNTTDVSLRAIVCWEGPFRSSGRTSSHPFPDKSERPSKNKWYERIERNPIFLLRLSLATVFLWFGLPKLADVSPVVGLLRSSIPILANTPFLQSLGFVEVCIAIGLSINRLSKPTVFLMILHLLATLSVAVLSPQLVFSPRFPILTM